MVDCEVRIAVQDRRVVRRWRVVDMWEDAVVRELDVDEDLEARIEWTNASASSRMIEWIRRCILLCFVLSNE